MRGVTSPPVLSQLLQDKAEEEEYFLKHRPHLSWEPMGSQSLGNLCEGPLAALHPSSQVTEFTSLIMGGNRKVIGIECCHRINVSQLHINVSASLYYLCLRNTVSSKCCLSTHHQETVSTGPACPQPHPRTLELPPPFFQGGGPGPAVLGPSLLQVPGCSCCQLTPGCRDSRETQSQTLLCLFAILEMKPRVLSG